MLIFLFKNKVFSMRMLRRAMKLTPETKKRAHQWLMGVGLVLVLIVLASTAFAVKSGEPVYWAVALLSSLMVYFFHFRAFAKIDEETFYEFKDLLERSRPVRRFIKGSNKDLTELEVELLMKMQFILSERKWARHCKEMDSKKKG